MTVHSRSLSSASSAVTSIPHSLTYVLFPLHWSSSPSSSPIQSQFTFSFLDYGYYSFYTNVQLPYLLYLRKTFSPGHGFQRGSPALRGWGSFQPSCPEESLEEVRMIPVIEDQRGGNIPTWLSNSFDQLGETGETLTL